MMRYHVFYYNMSLNTHHEAVFNDQAPVLKLVKDANEPHTYIQNLTVIYGEKVEFEPYEKVVSWRIKEH